MSVVAVVGAQWGDEGKGRVVDLLAQGADVVIRYQGGDNAGHTVVNEHGVFKLHMIPSGIFNPLTLCLVGAGCVVNPPGLMKEMGEVASKGVCLDNLKIDRRAHVVFPYHQLIDQLEEKARSAGSQIGTTGRGIGPAYADKASRIGIRMGDLLRPDYLRQRLSDTLDRKNAIITTLGGEPLDLEEVLAQALSWGAALKDRIVDTQPMIRGAVMQDKEVVLEGQLGVMRDLDWGIYPFVTSSNPIASGAGVGACIPPSKINGVLGVVKAYSTCVGAGPFTTELLGDTGDRLRKEGNEYGATTGRPRRCGWLDMVALRSFVWVSGITNIVITKLDVLDTFPTIRICTGYKLDGEVLKDFPDTPDLGRCTPIYEEWKGWMTPTQDIRKYDDLPQEARDFIERVETLAEVDIYAISVGPERDQMIQRS